MREAERKGEAAIAECLSIYDEQLDNPVFVQVYDDCWDLMQRVAYVLEQLEKRKIPIYGAGNSPGEILRGYEGWKAEQAMLAQEEQKLSALSLPDIMLPLWTKIKKMNPTDPVKFFYASCKLDRNRLVSPAEILRKAGELLELDPADQFTAAEE